MSQPPVRHSLMSSSEPPIREEEASRPHSRGAARFARIKHVLGLDRAIAFTLMARIWSTVAGVVTVLLIARFLTPAQQGYYYTFASLVALQIVFELGFAFVILQLAAHERAKLEIHHDGSITGDPIAHSRLASILQKAVRWYTAGAVLMAAVLLPAGFHFFYSHRQPGIPVHWQLPWTAVVLVNTVTFQMDPVFSFLEGCGRVPQVARMRFTQAFTGSLFAWSALLLHHGMFAPAMIIAGQAIAGGIFLISQRRLLVPLFRHRISGLAVSWRHDIWPFQWRIAISWLCGYFIFQLFNPVLFAFRGAKEAGQMGMSLTITSAMSAMALAWMNTKASPFGTMVARRGFAELDRLFFRTLWQSTLMLASEAVCFLALLAFAGVHFPQFSTRILPLPIFALLLATALCNHITFSEALYLRAHKREPFLPVSIAVGVFTACSTLLLGKFWGAAGVTIGYFFTSGILGAVLGTIVFVTKRRAWHNPSNLQEPDFQ